MKRGINVHIVEKASLESQIFKSILIQYIWMPGNILVDMDVASDTMIPPIAMPMKRRSMVPYTLGQKSPDMELSDRNKLGNTEYQNHL